MLVQSASLVFKTVTQPSLILSILFTLPFQSKLSHNFSYLFIYWGNCTWSICDLGGNYFAYPWFKKYHLIYLWYIFVNLRNPPQAQPLQKHLLTPKYNITRIKTPKTQKLFERQTCGEIKVLRNLCFLPLQTLQTTKNTLISPQVSLSKSYWVFGVLIYVMLYFGVKRCFCNGWTWGGLRRLTETYHRWVKWYFLNHG